MSQNTQNDFTPLSSIPGLKPVLAAALASLEVQLDQELTRYRRIRNTGKKHNSVNIQSFTGYNTKTNTSNQNQSESGTILQNTIQAREQRISLPSIPVAMPIVSVSNTINNNETVTTSEKVPQQEITDTEKLLSSIVPTKNATTEKEEIISTKDPIKQPDDYLESSEALLRSLNDEPTQKPKFQSSSNSILSPMGIGSMFLLLLASLTLGYVVLNPKNLPKWNLNLSNNNPSSSISSSENTQTKENAISSTISPTSEPEIKYPNLASQEFTQVRDPNDVVGLKPKIKPTPQITPTLTTQPPIPAMGTLPKLSPVPNVPNITSTPVSKLSPASSITSSPSPVPKATISLASLPEDIKPGANGYYYIITDNESQDSLAAAKKVVADAYLSPNGKFIYLGALKTKDDIKRRLQELADQGIAGRVQE
jgi:hypothetical protein